MQGNLEPLAGHRALITGAASGIGRATAIAFATAGADVAIVDTNEGGILDTAAAIAPTGRRVQPLVVDLVDTDAVVAVVPRVVAELGRVDDLVNAAGINGEASLFDLDLEEWERVQAVNLRAPFLLIREFARHVRTREPGGRIVNVSSSSAFRSKMSKPAYGASKAGLGALTRTAAAELGEYDVNVNTVVPGLTKTPIVKEYFVSDEDFDAAVREGPLENLLHRASLPEDVAEVILFLCSPGSRQITGQAIHTSAGAVV